MMRPTFLSMGLCVAALHAQSAPHRQLYLFAGQSNIAALARWNPDSAAVAPTNVHFWSPDVGEVSPWPCPLLEFGATMGAAFPQDQIHVAMIARDGSALLRRNDVGSGYWIDTAFLEDPLALVNANSDPLRARFVAAGLSFDEVHLVWGQGETDCSGLAGAPPLADEYWMLSQCVSGLLVQRITDQQTYSLHLVTPGAVLHPLQSQVAASMLREAYFDMEQQPLLVPGWSPTVNCVAHHYDLAHPDGPDGVHHLTAASYLELGRRIATGILRPQQLPRVQSLSIASPSTVAITVSVPLDAVSPSAEAGECFAVEFAGARLAKVGVEVAGNTILIHGPAVLDAQSTVRVRYITGSGYQSKWNTLALHTPAGLPLEPFVLSR